MRRSFLRKLALIRLQKGFLGDEGGGKGEKQRQLLVQEATELMKISGAIREKTKLSPYLACGVVGQSPTVLILFRVRY